MVCMVSCWWQYSTKYLTNGDKEYQGEESGLMQWLESIGIKRTVETEWSVDLCGSYS